MISWLRLHVTWLRNLDVESRLVQTYSTDFVRLYKKFNCTNYKK
jgi:hypothetical protein